MFHQASAGKATSLDPPLFMRDKFRSKIDQQRSDLLGFPCKDDDAGQPYAKPRLSL
jgi:hypothetical protein